MCLITLAYNVHATYPFILAANRDEFRERAAQPAHFWEDAQHVLAGRDLKAGGTWLGITRSGRFAAITNYRDLRRTPVNGPSRGQLVRAALDGTADLGGTSAYEGFNLLYGPLDRLRYHSNVPGTDEGLSSGIHGLSNHLLNTPWVKVERAKEGMARLVTASTARLVDGLFEVLADETPAPDERLPDTGLSLEQERAASSIFIPTPVYGTRCSTVLLVDERGNVRFEERTFPGKVQVIEKFRFGA